MSVRSYEFLFQAFPTWDIPQPSRRLDLKKVHVRIIPIPRFSLNSRHSGAFTSHYFLRSQEKVGAFAVLTIELTRGGKVPQITLWKQPFYRICAFREQRLRICARHWVIFVHERWLTLHPRNFSHLYVYM